MSKPYVTITEQPAGKSQRFRYLSEVDGARSVGSIPGVSSTPERRTYPSIHVHGHKGPFVVLLSLLNADSDLVHPHSITGSDPRYTCRNGVIFVIADEPDVVFKNIGILCVKGKTEKDVKSALLDRKKMNIDPFGAGFSHVEDHRKIDFTKVRICFQVFLPGPNWTPADRLDLLKYTRSLAPVKSAVVYDAKKLNELKIVHVTHCAGPLTGGTEMTLLCDKYTGQNPDVVFCDGRGWKETVAAKLYHKQLAIVFLAPPYREERDPISPDYLKVQVYLQQSGEVSQPATVTYLPLSSENHQLLLPTKPELVKRISLKQVRMHRTSSGSPEEGRQKRGRNSKEDRISAPEEQESGNTTSSQTDADSRAETIPLFDPETQQLLTHEWISNIDNLGSKYNWSDTVKAYYMQKRLSGLAKDWLSSIRHSDSLTWPQWKYKLLEAFPPRRFSYLDLLHWRSKMIKEDNSKTRSEIVHEINAKRAYACLMEGWPLQMKSSAEWRQYDTHHSSHPDYLYLAGREDPQNNAPQIRPINLNKADHKFAIRVKDVNPICHGNRDIKDYRRFDTISPFEERRGSCCCNNDNPCVIRSCSAISQNEMRPSCIIQRNQLHADRSWHQPCSTLTSSSSSPSMPNPAPDWSPAAPYPANIDLKGKGRGKSFAKRSDHCVLPGTSSQVPPQSPYMDIKMSPASCQEFSPSFDNGETDLSTYTGHGDNTNIASGYTPLNPSIMNIQENVLLSNMINIGGNTMRSDINGARNNVTATNMNNTQRNNMNLNTHAHMNTRMANLNLNPTLPPTSGANYDALGSFKPLTTIAAGPKIKRSVSELNREKLDSGELLPKRERVMPHESEILGGDESPTYANTNNPFHISNMQTRTAQVPISCCFPSGEENINLDNPIFSALSTNSHFMSIFDDILNMVNTEETWHQNINATMTADHNNINQNNFDPNNIDHNNIGYHNVSVNENYNMHQDIDQNQPYNVIIHNTVGFDELASLSDELELGLNFNT